MDNIPIAQEVVPINNNNNNNIPMAREVNPPPVSIFDLIQGRRYIITNRRVDALHIRNQPHFNSYDEGTHSFIGTFLFLTKPTGQYNYNSYHPINFFNDLERDPNDETEISPYSNQTLSPLFRDSSLLMNQSNVYPIFHYEQGLTEAQLQDLTLQAEFNWIRGDLYRSGGGPGFSEKPGVKLIQNFNGRIMPALTGEHTHYAPETIQSWRERVFNKIPQEPVPGLLYYGYDEHSDLYKGYSRWGGHMPNAAYTEERNFKYSMVKQWKTQWYIQNPAGNYNRNHGFSGGLPQAAKDAGYTSFAETYFNQPELLSNPNIGLTRMQSNLLRYNLMIVFPRYWSFTYNPEHWRQQNAEEGILVDRIRRGAIPVRPGARRRPRRERTTRRTLDGGKRKKTKRRKRKKKLKRKK
tara:strand:+ start:3164 stop:4387 length:1224 start_codon:yes stop_codon:yes gene_type:complete